MGQPIISVENLGKSYLVGHQSQQAERYTALRDVLGRNVRNFGRKAYDMVRGRQIVQGDEVEEFWALKDVSFEVNEGEVVGIIGRNGAGKSTLLKVLSRITEPTRGKVTLRGRVASLLEVGTGFHPELTGRENIFLNGAILGMTRVEIKKKFDEIVDFAGVEKFLDTPVKRYSSGMYVRLAFGVAAHLEPEVLIVDEVLAVGDAEFQKKSLGKMQDVASQGRTVIFVSHNMPMIHNLCHKSILLNAGSIVADGITRNVINLYTSQKKEQFETSDVTKYRIGFKSNHETRFLSLKNITNNHKEKLKDSILLEIEMYIGAEVKNARFGYTVKNDEDTPLFSGFTPNMDTIPAKINVVIELKIQTKGLIPGTYSLSLSCGFGDEKSNRRELDVIKDVLHFIIQEEDYDGPLVNWHDAYGCLINNNSNVNLLW
ncbi:MAG: polysaccharide ABC transporter ATP-binding protein [Methylococcaceae bacterium]